MAAKRFLIPIVFLAVFALVIANMIFLSVDPTSTLAWWISQEMYARLRGLVYLALDTGIRPEVAILGVFFIFTFCYIMRRSTFVCFVANHATAVALFYAAFSNFSVKAAALGGPAPLHLLLVMNWDWPVLLSLLAALSSCIPCHLDYLIAGRR